MKKSKIKDKALAATLDNPEDRCLYQTLTAHVLSDFLPQKDLKLLRKLSSQKRWQPAFFRCQRALLITQGRSPIYLLMETGTHFSEEYQAKTLDHFRKLGFSQTFLAILKAAQNQRVEPLLLSKNGCYAEPRTPPQLPENLQMASPIELLKDLRRFHYDYPIELLTNILLHHHAPTKTTP